MHFDRMKRALKHFLIPWGMGWGGETRKRDKLSFLVLALSSGTYLEKKLVNFEAFCLFSSLHLSFVQGCREGGIVLRGMKERRCWKVEEEEEEEEEEEVKGEEEAIRQKFHSVACPVPPPPSTYFRKRERGRGRCGKRRESV